MVNGIGLGILGGAALVALTACVTPEELRMQDEATCRGYGFTPASKDFANCLQQESLARRYWSGSYGSGWSGPVGYPPFPYPRY